MKRYRVNFMTEHPLRSKLVEADWIRIQSVINGESEDASVDEIEAAYDVLYDAVAGKEQTHLGVLTLQ